MGLSLYLVEGFEAGVPLFGAERVIAGSRKGMRTQTKTRMCRERERGGLDYIHPPSRILEMGKFLGWVFCEVARCFLVWI